MGISGRTSGLPGCGQLRPHNQDGEGQRRAKASRRSRNAHLRHADELAFYGANGERKRTEVRDDLEQQEFEIPLDFEPPWVDFDPDDLIDKTVQFDKSVEALMAEAKQDPQGDHGGSAEAGFRHPALIIRGPTIEARLNQDVQAHQQGKRVLGPLVVNQLFEDNKRPALGKRPISLGHEPPLIVRTLAMKNMTHDQDVGFRQGVVEKTARLKSDAVRQTIGADVLFKNRATNGQIEAHAPQC